MSLTSDDLQAIGQLIDDRVQAMLGLFDNRTFKRFARLEAKIDEAVEGLAQQTAAGLQEIHDRIDSIERVSAHRHGKLKA